MERYYTLQQLEQITHIKPRTWKLYLKQGKLVGVYGPNRRILIPESEVARFLENLPKTTRKEG